LPIEQNAATGTPPLKISAIGLPKGLVLDALEGVISGKVSSARDYRIQLKVATSLGKAERTLNLRVGDALALTPPMGWNSWNAYGLAVDAVKVRGAAEAMIRSGLAAHGWTYVNIDDGWEANERAPNGEIRTNAKFPDMPALSDYLHARGLRFGIYSSPGKTTCGRFLGSFGHERQDADTYARWGIDYLKYDQCSYELLLPKTPTMADYQAPYRLMGVALQALSRDIVYSLCQYGLGDVWTWGGEVRGNLWRTTGDIEDSWRVVKEIMDTQHVSAPYASPGHWNDPDMLVVGEVGWGGGLHPSRLTPDEQYSHLSLWPLLAAPLLLGNDLARLDAFTRNLLVNDEVIAVDQDPLGRAAARPMASAKSRCADRDVSGTPARAWGDAAGGGQPTASASLARCDLDFELHARVSKAGAEHRGRGPYVSQMTPQNRPALLELGGVGNNVMNADDIPESGARLPQRRLDVLKTLLGLDQNVV
jgi:hypothetical protein